MKILEKLCKNRIISDGGMGTILQANGLAPGQAPENFNLERPELIKKIHFDYFAAGADIASSNTFGINGLKYSEEQINLLVSSAVKLAKSAASEFNEKYVALDIGPLGRLLQPYGDLPFEEAVSAFAPVVKAGALAGADLVLIETMNDSYETKAAVLAAKENCSLPIFVTNVYDETSKLMTGADIGAMVALLEGLGVDALGLNCSLGPKQMQKLVPEFLRLTSLPLIVTPNAGMPRSVNGNPVYDVNADEFSDIMAKIAGMGARILGGCCGTTPEYIKKTVERTKNLPVVPIEKKSFTVVSSYTHAEYIGIKPLLIGERINPTGKPLLKTALRNSDTDFILREALSQQDAGAHILDVNTGLPELNEKETLVHTVKEIQSVCDLPLQIDTVDSSAMAESLRIYNGKPLINSVNGKEESMKSIFPLVKKYGGAVIALTIDESGIPKTAEGRLEIARKIVFRAGEYGIDKKDIIIDPLALTVSSDRLSAEVTLEAIRLIESELNVNTSLGVSNISFGLPKRDCLTASFFTLAMYNGLDLAIMNPLSEEMKKAYFSYLALSAKDESFGQYISWADNAVNTLDAPKSELTLKEAIIKGLKEDASLNAKELLKTSPPLSVIEEHIIPALDVVGKGFEEKTVYLPSLLMSAEAARFAFDAVKEMIPKSENASKGTVIVATVKGDIHDIGKNIVKVLLENFGFDVIDLGRDVDPQIIADEAVKRNCRLVGLSALMTTTVPAMQQTIELLKEKSPNTLTVVGGAVLTQEYADMIGADKYCKDAMQTVRYAEEVFKK